MVCFHQLYFFFRKHSFCHQTLSHGTLNIVPSPTETSTCRIIPCKQFVRRIQFTEYIKSGKMYSSVNLKARYSILRMKVMRVEKREFKDRENKGARVGRRLCKSNKLRKCKVNVS